MVLWKKDLDAYSSILEPSTSCVLFLVLEKQGFQTSIHITIYLSTSVREFMEDLALLQDTIDMVSEKYPDSTVFLCGNANASIHTRKDNKRDLLFKYFAEENKFSSVALEHKTYHNFVNNGKSDSNIDVLMYSKVTSDGIPSLTSESLLNIMCGKLNPLLFVLKLSSALLFFTPELPI